MLHLNGGEHSRIMLILFPVHKQEGRCTCSCTVRFVGVEGLGRDEEGGGMKITHLEKLDSYNFFF